MPRRRGRPGLMGVSRHGQQKAAAQQQSAAAQQQAMPDQAAAQAAAQVQAQQAAAAPPPPSTEDKVTKIKQLGELKDAGLLTEEEFAAEKAKILA